MTAENFCYWLKGYFEINDKNVNHDSLDKHFLSAEQTKMIKQHLDYVFKSAPVKDQLGFSRSMTLTTDVGGSVC